MIRFECDYTEGAHPRILERMNETNFEQTGGYGDDPHTEHAKALIRDAVKAPDADVWLLVGGTQTNKTVIAHTLRPYQGVISAVTGHINVHETGAIEASGHKVLAVPSDDGKITAAQVAEVLRSHYEDETHEHMVQPGMVYISHPTENGTLYTKEELTALSDVCKRAGIPLYMDGARMGYGLMAKGNDLFLPDIAKLCDVFYIGGTKVGALLGEAVVITNDRIKKDFRYSIKQNGGLFAKGRLIGIQFETLFEDGLYEEISAHADRLAERIHDAFAEKGFSFLYDSPTNQQFPILTDAAIKKLGEKYSFSFWSRVDASHSAVRFATSWATKEENVDALIKDIAAL